MGNIATPPSHYFVDVRKRELSQALYEGIEAMRRDALGQQRWMMPNPGDMRRVEVGGEKSMTRYQIRVRRSRFRNVFKAQIEEVVARVFSRDLVTEGWPEFVDEFVRDVDGDGRDLTTYERECFEIALVDGVHHTLVEHPPSPGERTLEQYRQSGDRPYWVPVNANDLVEAIRSTSGDVTEARIRFQESERSLNYDTGEFAEKSQDIIKLFVADQGVRVRPFIRGDKGWYPGRWVDIKPVRGELTGVPLVPTYGGRRKAPFRAWPFFEDAAEEQAGIWIKSSEKDWLASRCAIPMLFQSGVSVDEGTKLPVFESDPEGRLWSSDPGGNAKIVETSGQALGFLAEDIERDESGVKAGIQPHLERPSGSMTATEIGAREIRAKSILGLLSKLCVLSVRRKLQLTCLMAGYGPETWGEVDLPNNLGDNEPNKEELKELKTSGVMSDEGFWTQYKRAGGVTEDFDVNEEVQRLQAERDRMGL